MPRCGEIFERNIRALARTSPGIVRRLAQVAPDTGVEIFDTPEGGPSGVLRRDGRERALASRRRPLAEARRLVDGVDLASHGAIAVAGFGLGHHVRLLAERAGPMSLIIVYEPDVPLLRAVLEEIDCTGWLCKSNVVIVEQEEQAALASALEGFQALVGMGLELIEHPPSLPRLGERAGAFTKAVTSVVRALRTTLATTLTQSEITLRNCLMNVEHYAQQPGIEELRDSRCGRPGVVVSAGPSLSRNLDLLGKEGVRDRCTIIAVQTVLRPMLDRGIRPHFVVSLDHHEISRRFFEGLSEEDVRGVTLVAEPKVNPAVLDAFPGEIRLTADDKLDGLLGEGLARRRGVLPPGATVAHLAYELARHLGCDPVVLIGQDLGFTDGQYYADGAAIHDVWAAELGEFRTLEMFEHERIVRSRHQLTRATDQLGRPIYTDEQMHSYLVQFEELFERDRQRGLVTIDATEGGVAKRSTEIMPLRDALERFVPAVEALRAWQTGGAPPREHTTAAVRERIRRVRNDARRIGRLSTKTDGRLEKMLEAQRDQKRIGQLIAEVERIRDEVTALEPAWTLVQFINQTGSLNRLKADRQIELERDLEPLERQRRQIERDRANVRGLAAAAGRLEHLLERTLAAVDGGGKLVRDEAPQASSRASRRIGARSRVRAIIPVEPGRSSLGLSRDLAEPLRDGRNALELTLLRLAQSDRLAGCVLLAEEPERVRALLHHLPPRFDVQVEHVPRAGSLARSRAIASARLFAPASWRGGPAALTVYDELLDPTSLAVVMDDLGLAAVALVGPDWPLVDPDLTDRLIDRLGEREQRQLAFCQAAPGLAPVLLGRSLVADLARQQATGGPFASLAGVLGYLPDAGRADLIARDECVQIAPALRDVGARVTADCPHRTAELAGVLDALGDAGATIAGAALGEALASLAATDLASGPQQPTLEVCTGRLTSGERALWARQPEGEHRRTLEVELACGWIAQLAAMRRDLALTIGGAGDPLQHPDLPRFIEIARSAGVCSIHVRTDLLADEATIDALLDAEPDLISVDLLAHDAATYRRLAGIHAFERVQRNIARVLARRGAPTALDPVPTPWLVPRITRCDAVYEQIEPFYDHWLRTCGACVIDPVPAASEGERIMPLTPPRLVAARGGLDRPLIRCDGVVLAGRSAIGDLRSEPLERILKRVRPPVRRATAEALRVA